MFTDVGLRLDFSHCRPLPHGIKRVLLMACGVGAFWRLLSLSCSMRWRTFYVRLLERMRSSSFITLYTPVLTVAGDTHFWITFVLPLAFVEPGPTGLAPVLRLPKSCGNSAGVKFINGSVISKLSLPRIVHHDYHFLAYFFSGSGVGLTVIAPSHDYRSGLGSSPSSDDTLVFSCWNSPISYLLTSWLSSLDRDCISEMRRLTNLNSVFIHVSSAFVPSFSSSLQVSWDLNRSISISLWPSLACGGVSRSSDFKSIDTFDGERLCFIDHRGFERLFNYFSRCSLSAYKFSIVLNARLNFYPCDS